MKWILLLTLMACGSVKEKGPEVKKEHSEILDAAFYDLEGHYTLDSGKCEISWGFTRQKNKDKKNIHLSLRNSLNVIDCHLSFEELRSTHEAVLKELLKDFPAETIGSVSTGGFGVLDPSGAWNLAMAKASLNFKEKFFSNKLFVKVAKEGLPYRPFQEMFKALGLDLDLDSVEKLLAFKIKETSFKDQFSPSVQERRVMIDAGVLWWK